MKVALLDTMVVSYLSDAMAGNYDPASDSDAALRDERVAAFRLFLWHSVGVGETALAQALITPDANRRAQLERLLMTQLPKYRVSDEAQAWVTARANTLTTYHSDSEDCRIVAEAEALGVEHVVTFDFKLQRRLSAHSKTKLVGAAAYWHELAIAPGTLPKLRPAWNNPIGKADWWHW